MATVNIFAQYSASFLTDETAPAPYTWILCDRVTMRLQ